MMLLNSTHSTPTARTGPLVVVTITRLSMASVIYYLWCSHCYSRTWSNFPCSSKKKCPWNIKGLFLRVFFWKLRHMRHYIRVGDWLFYRQKLHNSAERSNIFPTTKVLIHPVIFHPPLHSSLSPPPWTWSIQREILQYQSFVSQTFRFVGIMYV